MMILKGLVALMLIHTARPHGRMMEPPNRSSLWRFWDTDPAIAPYKSIIEPNYGDNELFCGGFQHQVNLDGKCGICGDAYDKERENEAGGKYGKGIIVRQYQPGSVFEAKVDLTAHHLGFFEFRLCKWDNPTKPVTQECLDKNLLQLEDGGTQYFPEKPGSTVTTYTIRLKLPSGLTCSQCVIQWRYHAGNSWGYDDDGNYCTGCGPQEEFYGCADVAVGIGPTLPPPSWVPITSTATGTTTSLISRLTTTTKATTTTEAATTTVKPTSSTASSTSTTEAADQPVCHESGTFIWTCTKFYQCSASGGTPTLYECPPGTYFDSARSVCDHGYNVPPPCGTKT